MAEYTHIPSAPRRKHYLRVGVMGEGIENWKVMEFDTKTAAFAAALGVYLTAASGTWIVYFDPHEMYGWHWLSEGEWTPNAVARR